MVFNEICSTENHYLALVRIASCSVSWSKQSEVSEEIRNTTNTYCPQMNQKWPFLAKSQAFKGKGLPAEDCMSCQKYFRRDISLDRDDGKQKICHHVLYIHKQLSEKWQAKCLCGLHEIYIEYPCCQIQILDFVHSLQGLFLELEGISCLHPFMVSDNISTNNLTSCHRKKKRSSL